VTTATGSGLAPVQQAGHQAQVLGNLVRALELVVAAHGEAEVELRFHLRNIARWIGQRLEPHHDPEGLARRINLPDDLAVLVTGAPRLPRDEDAEPGVGVVEALLLDSDISGEAYLARVAVELAPPGQRWLPDGVGPEFAEALGRAQRLVFQLLLRQGRFRPDPAIWGQCGFRLEGPPATRRLATDGGSVAAAAAVAVCSRWLERPVPAGVVVTGCLGPDGAVLPVSGLEAKVRCALRERPRLRMVVVPANGASFDDGRVRAVSDLEQLLAAVFGAELFREAPERGIDVEGTLRLGLELYEKAGSFVVAQDVLQIVLEAIAHRRQRENNPRLFRVEQFVALWRAASCLVHLGDPDRARPLFEQASALGEELWEAREIDPKAYLGCRGNLAVLLRDLLEYEAAEQLLLGNLELQRTLRQDRREAAKTLGNLGELWTFAGRYDKAEAVLLEALDALRSVYPDEVPRELCYLGNLELRRGCPLQALACYTEGLQANVGVTYGQARNEAFLRYGLMRAQLALGQPAEAVREADRMLPGLSPTELYPRQLILKVRGLALLALGQGAAGERELERAADLTHASGPLARLAAGTALAELAIHLLDVPERQEEAVRLARGFLESGGSLTERLCPDLERHVGERPLDTAALAAALRQALVRFPY
jgi:tetratricopeptide (TPR) repeat protein